MESISITHWQLAALVSLTLVSVHTIGRVLQDRITRKGYPLPPGPTPLLFLGNTLSVNLQEPFKTYTEWQAKYGDIMYIRMLDVDVVVLNSLSVATDLLEKRSQIYSDRPFMAPLKLFGHDPNFAFARYGDHWKLCRRIFRETFRANTTANFHPIQLRKTRQLILNVMDHPSDYPSHYATFSSGATMCSVYDYDPNPQGDQIVSIVSNFIEAAFPALTPEMGALLKHFPFLMYMPDWLPGSSIKRQARVARELSAKAVEGPYQYVQRRLESKEAVNPSMVSDHIARMETFNDSERRSRYEEALKHASSTAFLGSVETTSSAMITFTLAMVKNPRIWKRAQADIDAVIGTDRLPEFDDRSSLPYVDAILRETLRWQPPGPLAAPHATTTSDIYNGFYIPKGATVFGNVWAMSRDETRYPEAEKFIPERFLDAGGMLTDDVPDFVFGFGRRMCPGRYIANASVWIAMATMLAAFDFNPAKDADGRDIEFEPKFLQGLARHPFKFSCWITPRPHINKASLLEH